VTSSTQRIMNVAQRKLSAAYRLTQRSKVISVALMVTLVAQRMTSAALRTKFVVARS
jgi:hypothetical protein